jgi:hypothetical protein
MVVRAAKTEGVVIANAVWNLGDGRGSARRCRLPRATRVRLATSLAMISAGNESQTQGRYMRAPRGEAQGSTPTA